MMEIAEITDFNQAYEKGILFSYFKRDERNFFTLTK